MSLLPANKKLKIWRGSTFRYMFTFLQGGFGTSPRDLTNYTSRLVVKDAPGGSTLVTLTNVVGVNGGIILGGTLGTVDVAITPAFTSSVVWTSAVYQLTIQAPTDGDIIPLLRGAIVIDGL